YNAVYMAIDGELGRLEAPMGESFAPGLYDHLEHTDDAKLYHLQINGKIYCTGFLLGDWRNKDLPFSEGDTDLLINLAARPLLLDDEQLQPTIPGRPMVRVNCTGLASRGKYNYLYSGGSYIVDAKGFITHAAPFLQSLVLNCHRNMPQLSAKLAAEELLTAGLIAGTKLFCEKIGVKRAVIGISGGIDSALAACVYTRALGANNVMLLNMPTKYNSGMTKNYAERMAKALHTNYFYLPIQNQVDEMNSFFTVHTGETPQGNPLKLTLDSFAMENIQSRERTRLLAAAAAAWKAVFTCNSNKAELAVGYCTFYGDLAGAFAAAADLWKYQVYQAAQKMQEYYPTAPLNEIIALRPSAELSFSQDVTKGLGDPLHYQYHDYLLRAWVEKRLDLTDVLYYYQRGELAQIIGCEEDVLKQLFSSNAAFIADTEYWWGMYNNIGVAKRYQAPPMLALSRYPLGATCPEMQVPGYVSQEFQNMKNQLTGGK
ncbi:MAG: NAD(+) synthase, partial [Clostridiales bacterium]